MRRIYFLFVFIPLFLSCSQSSKSLSINGSVKGLKKGMLYLQKAEDTTLLTIDSLKVDGNANFAFNYDLAEPDMMYLNVRLENGSLNDDWIAFYAEPGQMTIHTVLETFGNSARISGSANDSIYRNYLKIKKRFSDRNLNIIETRLTARGAQRDSILKDLELKEQSLLYSKYMATLNYAIQNKEYEVAPYLVLSEAEEASIKHLDSFYNAMPAKIKNSKYGKHLESLIKERKK